MRNKIENYAPVGMDLKKVWLKLIGIGMIPILSSLQFFRNLTLAVELQEHFTGMTGALYPMEDFVVVLGISFALFPIGVLGHLLLAVRFYRHHLQDTKSIYVMKRLPDSRELWRRVLTLPIVGAAALVVIAIIILVIYYGYYVNASMPGSVQPYQWQILIETWF